MGQFRFPIEYNALLDRIRSEFGGNPKLSALIDEIEPWIEQRDRVLEDYITQLPAVPSTGFDATVSLGATTNTTTRNFPTVFEAIRFLDTSGLVTARIGITARGGTITEIAALGSLTNLKAVEIVGTDGGDDDAATPLAGTRWSHGGFSTTGTILKTWVLDAVHVLTGAGKTEFFQGSGLSVTARNSNLEGSASASTTVAPFVAPTTFNILLLFGCFITDVNLQGAVVFDSIIFYNANNSHTQTLSVFQYGCYYLWTGAKTITNTAGGTPTATPKAVHLVGCTFGHTGFVTASSASDVLTLSCTGSNTSVVVTGSGDQNGGGGVAVSVSNHGNCYLDLQSANITVGVGTSLYQAQTSVGGTCGGTVDVTGPCFLNVTSSKAILRGKGIGGSLVLVYADTSGTALTGTAVTDSGLVVTARRHPGVASSSQKGYALDASSTRNVIIFSGKNDFPTASTDGGTSNVVITETGVSAVIPDIITAGGPTGSGTVVPIVTYDAKGRLTAVSSAAISGTAVDFAISAAGKGLQIKEGANAKMGTATLVGGTLVVNTTAVTANSRIFLTTQSLGTVLVPQAIAVTARTAGTSFTITSFDVTDTSVIAWMIVEPA